MPQSLLESGQQQRLVDALLAAARFNSLSLHFNKGLGGSPPDAIAASKDTATHPAVLTAFALVIVANGQDPAYPGIPGHAPEVANGRAAAERTDRFDTDP